MLSPGGRASARPQWKWLLRQRVEATLILNPPSGAALPGSKGGRRAIFHGREGGGNQEKMSVFSIISNVSEGGRNAGAPVAICGHVAEDAPHAAQPVHLRRRRDFLKGAPAGRARPPGGPCERMGHGGPPGGRPLPASRMGNGSPGGLAPPRRGATTFCNRAKGTPRERGGLPGRGFSTAIDCGRLQSFQVGVSASLAGWRCRLFRG